jgi:plastocyanin
MVEHRRLVYDAPVKKPLAVLASTTALGALALPALADAATVAVRDNVFGPKKVTISKGQKVKWVWRGDALHNVVKTSGPGGDFRSNVQTSGRYSHRFKRTGTYQVLCTIHAPDMKMKVVVR